jgi:site-specific DNA recombinase
MAAIYARVSSEQQREANTIASQTASLIEFAQGHDLEVPQERSVSTSLRQVA